MALNKVQISKLKAILSQSKTQITNPALYETIFALLDSLDKMQNNLESIINDLANEFNNASFLTGNDDSNDLPNSRQLLAGTSIMFDDTVANKRTVNASINTAGSQIAANGMMDAFSTYHDVYENEIYATLVNSSFGGSGSVGPAGPAGAQGAMGPPGFSDSDESDCQCMPFVGNIIS